ncbi:MAG: TonB family protein [Terriglobales bacterium]
MSASTLPHASQAAQLADIAARACKLTGGSGAAIALCEGDELLTVASTGDSAPDVGVPVSEGSFAGLCFISATVQVCSDTENDRRANAELCRALGVRSMIAAPIRCGQKVRGVLAVFAPVPKAFDGSVSVLTTLADIAGELAAREANATPPEREVAPAPPEPPAGPAAPVAAATTLLQMPAPTLREASALINEITAVEPPKPAPRTSAVPIVPPPSEPPRPGKLDLLLPAEDPGPAVFHPVAPTPPPAFAMLDQLQKPARQGRKRARFAAVAVGVVALVAIGGWRLHANRSNTVPVLAAVSDEIVPETTPAMPDPVTTPAPPGAEPVTITARSSNEPAKAQTPQVNATGVAKPTAAEPEPAAVLPERKELAILMPTARPKPEPEPEVAAPAVTVTTNALPELTAKPYVPAVAAAKPSQFLPARLLKSVAPVYPSIAKNVKVNDTVVVSAVIDKEGRMTNMRVVRGMVMFHHAALEALRQWRYEPATLNGSPIESSVQVEVRFKGSD